MKSKDLPAFFFSPLKENKISEHEKNNNNKMTYELREDSDQPV